MPPERGNLASPRDPLLTTVRFPRQSEARIVGVDGNNSAEDRGLEGVLDLPMVDEPPLDAQTPD